MCRTLDTVIRSLDFIQIDLILIINRQELWEAGRGVVVRVWLEMGLCPEIG